MNFVNRHIADRAVETADLGSDLSLVARKWPIRYDSIEFVTLCADVATILCASIVSGLLAESGGTANELGTSLGYGIIASAFFASVLKANRLYQPTELLVLRGQVRAICLTWASLLLLAVIVDHFKAHPDFSRGAGPFFALLGLASLIAERCVIRTLLISCLSGRKFAEKNIVLITDQPLSLHAGLSETLAILGFRVTSRFSLPPIGFDPTWRKRLSARVIEHIRSSEIDEIVVEATPDRWSDLRAFIADLRVLPFPIMFVPVGAASDLLRHPTRKLGSAVCVELQSESLTAFESTMKRAIDLIGACLVLIASVPLVAIVALAIKVDSPGPVLFRQQRCGFNGRIFSIRKFRTMHVLEDGPYVVQAVPADRRVTRVGRWLRRTSLDELPQLLNVLDGSMSLVGPRPHALAHDGQFEKLLRSYALRRRVKPGLTGWAQIHGCRGPTNAPIAIERRVEYDLWYINNWSLKLDLAILLRTPIEVLRGRNAV
ncbi:exopolysaccharide biosynthesis polyprenyl glycosylphosphotransferase [Bradyrhizobium sp. UFLA05-112]